MPVTSRQYTRPKQRLLFYSVFNLVGSLWTFATTSSHYDVETYSFMARFSNDYDHINGLFDDTINNICHQIHAYATSNKCFTYSQMLREEDNKQFFKAMEVELDDHEVQNHWTLMECNNMPPGAKILWLSGLLNVSIFRMEA